MKFKFEDKDFSKKLLFLVPGFILGSIILRFPSLSIYLVVILIVSILLIKKPLAALFIFIFFVPYTETDYFAINFAGIPGAKPMYLFVLYSMLVFIFNYPKSNRLSNFTLIFIISLLTIFAVSIFRSIHNLDVLSSVTDERITTSQFILSDFIKPILFFIPFIIILKFVKNQHDLEKIINSVAVSLCALSIIILLIFLTHISDYKNLKIIENSYLEVFSLHRNDLANFYILGFPIIISIFMTRKSLLTFTYLCLTALVIGILYSRTAYLTFVLSFALYFALSKRKKWIPFLIIFAVLMSFFVSGTIERRAMKGFESGSIDEISANRIEKIWKPLIKEYIKDPKKLFFGKGRYGIRISKAFGQGEILEVSHPHNMYLELLLDTGIIGTSIYLFFLLIIVKRAFQGSKNIKDKSILEKQYGIIVAIICYFIAGLTGRTLFPNLINAFFWVILGINVAITEAVYNNKAEGVFEHNAELLESI